jgi:hypothetical protein
MNKSKTSKAASTNGQAASGKSRYWLSFDLGLRGDYGILYTWLDQRAAKECAHGLATFESDESPTEIVEALTKELKITGERPQLYLLYRDDHGKIAGRFILGSRRKAPWTGYAEFIGENTEDVGY